IRRQKGEASCAIDAASALSSQRVAIPGRTPRSASARAANTGEPPVLCVGACPGRYTTSRTVDPTIATLIAGEDTGARARRAGGAPRHLLPALTGAAAARPAARRRAAPARRLRCDLGAR